MKIIALFVFACCVSTSLYATDLPKDGNGLLDYCGVMVDFADNESAIPTFSNDKFTDKMEKFSWCTGYLQGTQDVYDLKFVHLATYRMAGLTFGGPEKLTQYAAKSLRGPCFPDNAPVLQLARVLVKWLREHPERLHEYKHILTTDAFTDAFPCQEPPAPAKPATAKP